jgi:carbon monoxide dehydrogenase subunit G
VPSVHFEREIAVAADTAMCWRVLTDLPTLVSWMSIVDDAKEIDPLKHYTALLADRVGPFTLRADLDIVLTDMTEGQQVRVTASGEDRQVSSRIGVDAYLRLAANDSGCTVSVDGTYEVSGKVATMGAGTIRKKADKVMNEFFAGAESALGG